MSTTTSGTSWWERNAAANGANIADADSIDDYYNDTYSFVAQQAPPIYTAPVTPTTGANGEDQAGDDEDDENGTRTGTSWWRTFAKQTSAAESLSPAEQTAVAVAGNVVGLLNETPEQYTDRRYKEREARYEAAGETPEQRDVRHATEKRDRERSASALWRQNDSVRRRRFLRWCLLTAASASVGYGMGLVQIAVHLPFPVALIATGGTWLLDVWTRGWGNVRVTDLQGMPRVGLVIVTRIPYASCLVAVLGLAPVFALTAFHH